MKEIPDVLGSEWPSNWPWGEVKKFQACARDCFADIDRRLSELEERVRNINGMLTTIESALDKDE